MADTKLASLTVILLPIAILILHACYYYPFFVDDAFISLRYAERLLTGHGLTWNDGEPPVEGYSNLLWVLLTAGLGYAGFDLVAAGRAICLLGTLATMAAFCFYHRYATPQKTMALFFAQIVFVLTGSVAIWSIGGLEATLAMALLAWAYVFSAFLLQEPCKKNASVIGVLLGLLCLTRPEGAFFAMAIAAAVFLCVPYPKRRVIVPLILLCAVAACFFAAQVAFRLYYYGDWMPNTYYAKLSPLTRSRLINGLVYSITGMATFLPIMLAICLQGDKLFKKPEYARARYACMFFALLIAAWLVPLTLAGGDMEPGFRHILFITPLIILLLMETLAIAYDSGPAPNTHIFCGYILACFLWLQFNFDSHDKARQETWVWQMRELGEWLGKHYSNSQPLIGVSNAGAIPYYSKLPTLDMYGINDVYLTRNRSKLFGHGFLGHELFDSDYVLKRKPDIIVFFTGYKKAVYGADIDQRPEFLKQYTPVEIDLPSYTPIIWVRKDSKKVANLGACRGAGCS